MLFNSLQFALFFTAVFSLYAMLNHKWQNRMLLVASYIFYASWDWKFLLLILIPTVFDYFLGFKIDESNDIKRKKIFFLLSIFINLSILGTFKYFNFFADNLQVLLNFFGLSLGQRFFNIILPVGMSFYIFKSMTYTINIYWGQMKPTQKLSDYALYLAFFPALLAGPIDRAHNFIPQIISSRKMTLDKFYDGCFLVCWGLFQKIFIADNLIKIVDPVFASNPPYEGATVLIALYAFVLQLYCDFAGYSNIAIGLGKILGFNMMTNFNLPLFAVNLQDFWSRWHISLSSWLRDYVYIPIFLNFRRMNEKARLSFAIIITMILIGIWHGSTWNFFAFGVLEGFLLTAYQMIRPAISNYINPQNRFGRNSWLIIRILFMFQLTALSFLIFRAQSMSQMYHMIYGLTSNFGSIELALDGIFRLLFFSWILIAVEIIQFWKNDQLVILKWNTITKSILYFICFYLMILYGIEGGKEFVYFQF